MPTATRSKRKPQPASKAPPRRRQAKTPAPAAAKPGPTAHVVLYDNGHVHTFTADGEVLFASPGTPAVRERVADNAPAGCSFSLRQWGQGAKGARDLTREQFRAGRP